MITDMIKRKKYMLIAISIFSVYCSVVFINRATSFDGIDIVNVKDLWVNIFGGAKMDVYGNEISVWPVRWMFVQMVFLFSFYLEPINKYNPIDVAVLLKSKVRVRFFVRKFFACVMYMLVAYASVFVGIVVTSLVMQKTIDFSPLHSEYFKIVHNVNLLDCNMIALVMFPFLVTLSISSIQLVLSIVFNNFIGMFFCVSYMTFNIFSTSDVCIENLSMLYRSLEMSAHNEVMIVGNIVVTGVAFVLGIVMIKRYEVM